jgi:D-xylonolactonase
MQSQFITADAGPVAAWSLGTTLGEGPVWVARERAPWFTDIKQRQIHRFDPATGARSSWPAPEQVGFVQPARGGGFVVGLQSGLARFDPNDGRFVPMVEVDPDRPGNRLNDSTVDDSGRLWFGTMDDGETERSGAVHRLLPDGSVRKVSAECPITNGSAISPDGRTLYHVDTVGRIIHASVDADGALIDGRVFAIIDVKDGYPDGVSVDQEGSLWLGLWGGWAARRYAADGTILATVRFPVANVTKIAFGGPGLGTAFATTALHGLDARALAAQPLAGALFSFPVDVPGLAGTEISVGLR